MSSIAMDEKIRIPNVPCSDSTPLPAYACLIETTVTGPGRNLSPPFEHAYLTQHCSAIA